jgi:hypothetical protein
MRLLKERGLVHTALVVILDGCIKKNNGDKVIEPRPTENVGGVLFFKYFLLIQII